MEFEYNVSEKDKCWYLSICDKKRCGNNFCIRHYKMSALMHMAQMTGKLQYPITLYPDQEDLGAYRRLRDIKNDISNFVHDGKNLLIYSPNTGNGKTEWAKKMMLSWFDSIWPYTDFICRGLFISMPRFIKSMKENISKPNEYYQYIADNIYSADLVVFDELNYKDWSDFEQDAMLDIISQRQFTGLANIYTTNFDIEAVADKLGSRLASRIVGTSELVKFTGLDKRNSGCSNG